MRNLEFQRCLFSCFTVIAIPVLIITLNANSMNALAEDSADRFKLIGKTLSTKPKLCAIEQQDDRFEDEEMEDLLSRTRSAVNNWSYKLQTKTGNYDSWGVEVLTVHSEDKSRFDYSRCDIIVDYKREPASKELKYDVLGLTQFPKEKGDKIRITIYYLEPVVDSRIVTFKEGNVLYYYYEFDVSYLQDKMLNSDQLQSTIRHELGHAFGLGHYFAISKKEIEQWKEGKPPSIMIPSLHKYQEAGITPLDTDKIIELYGQKGWEDSKVKASTKKDRKMEIEGDCLSEYNSLELYDDELIIDGKRLVEFTGDTKVEGVLVNCEFDELILYFADDQIPDRISVNKQFARDTIGIYLDSKRLDYEHNIDDTSIYVDLTFEYYGDKIKLNGINTKYLRDINEEKSYNRDRNNLIPVWVKNNVKWWSENKVGDAEFRYSIGYLIDKDVIQIKKPDLNTEVVEDSTTNSIPAWIKSQGKWWSEGNISEKEFLQAIRYLVENRIIKIPLEN